MGRLQKKRSNVEKTKLRLKLKEKADSYSRVNSESDDSIDVSNKPLINSVTLKDSKLKLVQPIKKDPFVSRLSELKKNNSLIEKGVNFLNEVKIELNKVTWPTRQQTTASTIVVIILVIIMSIFLGIPGNL